MDIDRFCRAGRRSTGRNRVPGGASVEAAIEPIRESAIIDDVAVVGIDFQALAIAAPFLG